MRPCPVCGSTDANVIMAFTPEGLARVNESYTAETIRSIIAGEEEGLRYSRCLGCGMVYAQHRWSETILKNIYSRGIDHRVSRAKSASVVKRESLVRLWLYISRVLRLVKYDAASPLSVCDYGCGWGDLLDVLSGVGTKTVGFELDEEKVTHARSNGHSIVTSEKELESEGPFDVIVMNSVLEHLSDVSGVMEYSKELLNPNGILVVTTMDYRIRFLRRNALRLQNGKPALTKSLNPIEHVNVFDYRTLMRLLNDGGFKLITTALSLRIADGFFLSNIRSAVTVINSIERLLTCCFTGSDLGITVFAQKK